MGNNLTVPEGPAAPEVEPLTTSPETAEPTAELENFAAEKETVQQPANILVKENIQEPSQKIVSKTPLADSKIENPDTKNILGSPPADIETELFGLPK